MSPATCTIGTPENRPLNCACTGLRARGSMPAWKTSKPSRSDPCAILRHHADVGRDWANLGRFGRVTVHEDSERTVERAHVEAIWGPLDDQAARMGRQQICGRRRAILGPAERALDPNRLFDDEAGE